MRLLPAIVSSLAIATSLLAQRVAEAEPNNTAGTAQAIVLGTQVDGSLATGEQDWFSFTVPTTTRVRMQTHTFDRPLRLLTTLQLWDATGTQVLGIDCATAGSDSTFGSLTLELTAGTYKVQVLGRYSYSSGTYSLDVAEIPTVLYSGTEVEPNGSMATATAAALAPGANRFVGTLAPNAVVSTRAVSYGFIAVTGLSSSSGFSANTFTVTNMTLTPGAYEGGCYSVFVRGGTGPIVGQTRRILSNTATTITTDPFPAQLGSTISDIYFTTSISALVPSSAMTNAAWNAVAPGFARFQVRFTSGVNNGLRRLITSNTGSWIQLEQALPSRPGQNDTFVVEAFDCDYWRIVLTAPTTGLWFRVAEGRAPFVFGHRLELLGSTGQPLDSTTLGANSATTTDVASRTSEQRVWPAGTYHVVVRPTDTAISTPAPANASNPSGSYALEIHASPMGTGGIVVETEALGGPAANQSAATATPIAPGQIGRGNLTDSSGADASDWWGPIVITTPSTLWYQTRRGAAPFTQDTTIHLRDANGAILRTSTDGNLLSPTSHARGITAQLLPQTYYLEVVSPGTDAATQAGNYELELGTLTETLYMTATYTDLGGNGMACSSRTVLSTPTYGSGTTFEVVSPNPLPSGAYDKGGFWVRMTSGANAGEVRPIVWNGPNQIQVSPVFPSPVGMFDTFDVIASPSIAPHMPGELPLLGTTFARRLLGCPANSIYIHMIGFSDSLASGSVPLPLDMAIVGAPGCTANVDPALLNVGVTDGAGVAELILNLPAAPVFRGFVFYEQGIVNMPTANAFGAVFTNYRRAITGESAQ